MRISKEGAVTEFSTCIGICPDFRERLRKFQEITDKAEKPEDLEGLPSIFGDTIDTSTGYLHRNGLALIRWVKSVVGRVNQ